MSTINIEGVQLYYEKGGRKGLKVLLLHGWGTDSSTMRFVFEHLKKHFIVYNIDFPGFGNSSEPPCAWGSLEYCECIRRFAEKKQIEEPIIIAHSFGCRVALQYALRYPVRKMVLTGAAGIRDRRSILYYIRTYTYKLGKKILSLKPFAAYREALLKKAGSEDYRNSSGVMRSTFVKTVNEDLKDILKDIDTETLLVFGENDDATPPAKGREMERLMGNATLVIFENDDHYAYLHQAERFNMVLDAFLRSDYE